MIRHCVFVKYSAGFGRGARDTIYADLGALAAKLPGMRHIQSGPNVSPEGLGKGYDEGFTIDFDDAATRDAYLIHPDHQAIGARLVGGAAGGPDGVFVFDFEL